MPCTRPLQALFSSSVNVRSGKRAVVFSAYRQRLYRSGKALPDNPDALQLPCGRCMACRLERSRQIALRCVHEAKCYEDNCFVTLTYSVESLRDFCPNNSLVRRHLQDFMKALRQKFEGTLIRFYGCGEYGQNRGGVYGDGDLGRPHYHLCLFNFSFPDSKKWKKVNGFWYCTSEILDSLWKYGFCTVSDFSFETAAYCARYCCKKVNGSKAREHYGSRLPEFSAFSNRPGIGKPWFDKFAKSDLFPHDSCVARGVECKPPRYYDVLRERVDPDGFALAKSARRDNAEERSEDNTFARLAVKDKCLDARMRLLVRKMEFE